MAERSYTIAEIDRMREAIRWSYPTGVSYYPQEREADIESRLRTYMQNGTALEEVLAWCEEQMEADRKYHEEAQRLHEEAQRRYRERREKNPLPEPVKLPGFPTTTSDHPFRCAKCHKMQPSHSTIVWVVDSAQFFDNDSYDRLAHASAQSSHSSGWCGPCVEKTKRIKDDFSRPEPSASEVVAVAVPDPLVTPMQTAVALAIVIAIIAVGLFAGGAFR